MNANYLLDALELIDDNYIVDAKEHHAMKPSVEKHPDRKVRNPRRRFALAAVIAAVLALALSGLAAYELGWFDSWLQKPSVDPLATVQSAIENQLDKEYTIRVRIHEIKVDEEETKRILEMYSGSELAKARGWTDEYLAEHFVVVWANYYVEYDHAKTFMNDGDTEQFFYLTQSVETREWTIIDNTSPNT